MGTNKVNLLKADGYAALIAVQKMADLIVAAVRGEPGPVEIRVEDARFKLWDDLTVLYRDANGTERLEAWQVKRQTGKLKKQQMVGLLQALAEQPGIDRAVFAVKSMVDVTGVAPLAGLESLCARLQSPDLDRGLLPRTLSKDQTAWLRVASPLVGGGLDEAVDLLACHSVEARGTDGVVREHIADKLRAVAVRPEELRDRLRAWGRDTMDSAGVITWEVLEPQVAPFLTRALGAERPRTPEVQYNAEVGQSIHVQGDAVFNFAAPAQTGNAVVLENEEPRGGTEGRGDWRSIAASVDLSGPVVGDYKRLVEEALHAARLRPELVIADGRWRSLSVRAWAPPGFSGGSGDVGRIALQALRLELERPVHDQGGDVPQAARDADGLQPAGSPSLAVAGWLPLPAEMAVGDAHVWLGGLGGSLGNDWGSPDDISMVVRNEGFEPLQIVSCRTTWALESDVREGRPLEPLMAKVRDAGDKPWRTDSFTFRRRVVPGQAHKFVYRLTPEATRDAGVDTSELDIGSTPHRNKADFIVYRSFLTFETAGRDRASVQLRFHYRVDEKTHGWYRPVSEFPSPTLLSAPSLTGGRPEVRVGGENSAADDPPERGSSLFTWLHLSDLHFGHGDPEWKWDQELVLTALRRDLTTAANRPPGPIDAILVTGDVAFSGGALDKSEYTKAAAWLHEVGKAVGVPNDRIFVVPGNHDVHRARGGKSAQELLGKLRGGSSTLDAALNRRASTSKLLARQGSFFAFTDQFADVGRDDHPWWVKRVPARDGLSVRLVGWNTALLCNDDEDREKLCLGNGQIASAFREDRREGEVVVVLTHHPFEGGWLADEGQAAGWARRDADVHLCGHIHAARSCVSVTGAGSRHIRVVAGAAHVDGKEREKLAHGYSFGEILHTESGELALRVRPRRWRKGEPGFIVDADSVPDGAQWADHGLGSHLAGAGDSGPVAELQMRAAGWDVALSVNEENRFTARALARRLADSGLRVWLGDGDLHLRKTGHEEALQAMTASRWLVICFGSSRASDFQTRLLRAWRSRVEPQAAQSCVRVLLPGASNAPNVPESLGLPVVLDYRAAADWQYERLLKHIGDEGDRGSRGPAGGEQGVLDVPGRGPDRLGVWTLGDRLGRGGYGEVFAATDAEGREAAVKVFRPGKRDTEEEVERGRRRFRSGPEALRKLAEPKQHPHIVGLWEGPCEADDRLWYAMRRVRGPSLRKLGRNQLLARPLEERLKWFRQIAEAVQFAHERPEGAIHHRDLTPENILVDQSVEAWRMVVCDFDLARDETAESMTRTVGLVGKMLYIPPEQQGSAWDGGGQYEWTRPAGHVRDLWSLGMLLHFLVCGYENLAPHVRRKQRSAVWSKGRDSEASTGPVEELVGWLLSAEPQQRPQDMSQVLQRLSELSAESGEAYRPSGAESPASATLQAPRPGTFQELIEHVSVSRVNWRDRTFATGEADPADALVRSIRVEGVRSPLLLREVAGALQIIRGFRRFATARQLHLLQVPAIVLRGISDDDCARLRLLQPTSEHPPSGSMPPRRRSSPRPDIDAVALGEIEQITGRRRRTLQRYLRVAQHPSLRNAIESGRLSIFKAEEILKAGIEPGVAIREGWTVKQIRESGRLAPPGPQRADVGPRAARGRPPESTSQEREEALRLLAGLWCEIPPGTFVMGSSDHEEGRWDDESPRVEVRFDRGFRMLSVPVTNRVYELFDPGHCEHRGFPEQELDLAAHPVINVDWQDAAGFCEWLGGFLPSGAEWEYACRAGTSTRYWSGDAESDLADVGWYVANSGEHTQPVGSKRANPWGLHDMHGNVWEWTSTRGRPHLAKQGVHVEAPPGRQRHEPGGNRRVVRGGSWGAEARGARSACRDYYKLTDAVDYLGFRVVVPIRSPVDG